MSETHPVIKVACEGDTDFEVIKSVISSIEGIDPVITLIQPEKASFAGSDYGETGGGYRGVRSWCRQITRDFGRVSSDTAAANTNFLVIHVDADIAGESEIDCEKPCPPALDTVNAVVDVVLDWCGHPDCDEDRIAFCVPSKSIEAWMFTALYPTSRFVKDIECRPHPESLLVGKAEKLVRKKGGKYRKSVDAYKNISSRFKDNWETVLKKCTQAAAFQQNLLNALSTQKRTN